MEPTESEERPAQPTVVELLNRPVSERLREYKYRFAQGTVFGLPVAAVSVFGYSLGGAEAGRWVGLLQILMGGWVMYVGALAMVVEALVRRKWSADGAAGSIALALYVIGLGAVGHLFVDPRPMALQQCFLWAVVVVCAWNGWRWFRLSGRDRSTVDGTRAGEDSVR